MKCPVEYTSAKCHHGILGNFGCVLNQAIRMVLKIKKNISHAVFMFTHRFAGFRKINGTILMIFINAFFFFLRNQPPSDKK